MRLAILSLLVLTGSWPIATDQLDQPVSGLDGPDPYVSLVEGVKGIVRLAAGAPVRDVVVEAQSLGPDGPPVPDLVVVTDRDGRYAWRLSPGRYAISIRLPGCEVFSVEVEVANETVTRLDIQLSCGG